MKVVIMAGGKGTRISSIVSDRPKPMIPIENVPILEYEIERLRDQGFTDIIITVSYLADVIMNYFGDGNKISPATGKPFNVHIEYYVESKPLGNAGALLKMKNELNEDFLLINADVIYDIDFKRFVDFHKRKGAIATLFTHPNSHPYDSGLIVSDSNGCVRQWLTKEDNRPQWYKNQVNAGIQVINPKAIELVKTKPEIVGTEVDGVLQKVDLDRDVLKPLAGTGLMFSYESPEYVKDMGTPERFEQVKRDLISGVVAKKSLKQKQRAIFLDRDGTINKYVGFCRDINDFELIPGIAKAIKMINDLGFLCIVVTNQPVIARGELSVQELDSIHNKMETLLGREGAYIDKIYYCPHHPHKGYKGEIPELKISCECRKPNPGMLLKAANDYNIDLFNSWMVGDSESDILAGKNAGCKTALLGVGSFNQDKSYTSLIEFVYDLQSDFKAQ